MLIASEYSDASNLHFKARDFNPLNYTPDVVYNARAEWFLFGELSESFTAFKARATTEIAALTTEANTYAVAFDIDETSGLETMTVTVTPIV